MGMVWLWVYMGMSPTVLLGEHVPLFLENIPGLQLSQLQELYVYKSSKLNLTRRSQYEFKFDFLDAT